jgi:hypothetical protein
MRHFELASILQVRRDPDRAKRVAADLRLDADGAAHEMMPDFRRQQRVFRRDRVF